jgi:hypothetical protein
MEVLEISSIGKFLVLEIPLKETTQMSLFHFLHSTPYKNSREASSTIVLLSGFLFLNFISIKHFSFPLPVPGFCHVNPSPGFPHSNSLFSPFQLPPQ